MAARRVSTQFFSTFQRSNMSSSFQPFAVPRQATAVANERSTYGGSFFADRRLHSESQAKADNEQTKEYESNKMTAEGGGPGHESFQEKAKEVKGEAGEKLEGISENVEGKANEVKDTIKEKGSEVGDQAKEVGDQAKGQVDKNVDSAKDMFKDLPQKASETATGLKEVGVEAAKAVKRDAGKVAEKVGLKSE